jgi:hypothetical protein
MSESLTQAKPARAGHSLRVRRHCRFTLCSPLLWLVLLIVLIDGFGIPPLRAHDIIDTDQANGLVAAVDAAAARLKTAAATAAEGEAWFALGMALVEATAVLNRDLAAHNGRLTVNAELVQKSLAQRDMAPPFDKAIGRYRLPRDPLMDAVRLAPDAPYAQQARFELLKSSFYESFVIDPFELLGITFDDLERQIAEAAALAAALSSRDDAEEAAFIHAIDLARAARVAPKGAAAQSYADKARAALGAFAKSYPDSMRAAAASMILKGLGGS